MKRTAAALAVLCCLGRAQAQETETYVLRQTVSNRGTDLKKLYSSGIPDQVYRGREFPFGRTGSRPWDPLAGLPGQGDLRLASATRQAIEEVTGQPAVAVARTARFRKSCSRVPCP